MTQPKAVGHSVNLVGLPTALLASCVYNDHPQPLHIAGVREMNPNLFEMLSQAEGVAEAAQGFNAYMMAMFGLDPEQREHQANNKRAIRRFRSSYLRLIKGWGYDSNSPEGAVFKGWVESRFGIFPTFHRQPIRRVSSGPWTTYIEEKMSSRFHNNSIYTQLDLVYEFCQWTIARLAFPGMTHLTLHRGVNDFKEHPIVERIDRRNAVIRINNLASFSSERDIAECFGDTVLTAHVPVAKIVFFKTLLPAHPLKGEGEFMVIGGEYRVATHYD